MMDRKDSTQKAFRALYVSPRILKQPGGRVRVKGGCCLQGKYCYIIDLFLSLRRPRE